MLRGRCHVKLLPSQCMSCVYHIYIPTHQFTVSLYLKPHITNNNLLHLFHSSYHSNTKTIHLHIVNDSLVAFDSGKVSFLTLLDLWQYWPHHPSHLPRVHIWNPQYRYCLVQVLSLWPVPNSVSQQHAVWSCQTFLWHLSRFSPGACPLHLLYYPSSLHHQPSQLDNHFYDDNTQLLKSAFPENTLTLLKKLLFRHQKLDDKKTSTK